MKMNNRTYDVLKNITLIYLPAFITLLGIVMQSWNICTTDVQTSIITTLTAFDAFMGTCLQISTANYNEGNH